MLMHILQGLFSFWLFGSFLHALGCMGKGRQLYEALMKNYQMTEKDRDFTGGVNMEKIIRALHLIHDYVQKDENGNIESKNRVLRDISVDIEAGSFVVLLGHNGSGKSTLARHLNALLQPTEGTVWINGHDTKEQREWLEIRKTAGMVFQNPDNQIIASVVEEDVAFGPENMGVPRKKYGSVWQRVWRV